MYPNNIALDLTLVKNKYQLVKNSLLRIVFVLKYTKVPLYPDVVYKMQQKSMNQYA